VQSEPRNCPKQRARCTRLKAIQRKLPLQNPDYLQADKIDDHFAELHFRLGRCYAALREMERAKKEFELARDWDALQFRTDSSLNGAIRECATAWRSRGVVLVDTERAFAETPPGNFGIPGEKLFHDNVHPTFAGNYLIATNVLPAIDLALGQVLGPAAPAQLLSQDQCANSLAYTEYEDVNVVAAMARMTSTPPFLDQLDHATSQAAAEAEVKKRLAGFTSPKAESCIQIHESVLQQRPDDWPVRLNLASLLLELGRAPEAARNFKMVADRFPDRVNFRLALAAALAKAGDRTGALHELEAARRIDPAEKQVEQAIKSLHPDSTNR
jgi:tetratricopeptide (TPR) repeat protein